MSDNTNTDPNSITALLATMTPEIHRALKTAVELGHWENGEKLTAQQKEHCLQAIIAYDKAFISPQERVGFISREGSTCSKPEATQGAGQSDDKNQKRNNTH
jgi:uncharacterized protein YeaC (DUF1315 family)